MAIPLGVAAALVCLGTAQAPDDADVVLEWASRFATAPAIRSVWMQLPPAGTNAEPAVIDTVFAWGVGLRETVRERVSPGDASASGAGSLDPWQPGVVSVLSLTEHAPTVRLEPGMHTFMRSDSAWTLAGGGAPMSQRTEWVLARAVADGLIKVQHVSTSGDVTQADAGEVSFALRRQPDRTLVLERAAWGAERVVEFSRWEAAPEPLRWAPTSATVTLTVAGGAPRAVKYERVAIVPLREAPAGLAEIDLRDARMPDRERGVVLDAGGMVTGPMPQAQTAPSTGLGWRLSVIVAGLLASGVVVWRRLRPR